MKAQTTTPTHQATLFDNYVSEIQLNYGNASFVDCDKIGSSEDAAKILRNVWQYDLSHREAAYILCPNKGHKVIGYSLIGLGGISSSTFDPRLVFQTALPSNASAVILAHNHPSGNTEPSQSDINLTKRMKEAGEMLDIQVLDHVILTVDTCFSFADENLI